MLTLARSNDELSAAEIRENSLKMSWLVQAAHESFARLISTRSAVLPVQLTSREIEVLRWTADGKTSGDVGQIMNISERTVNFHVNNAIEKLVRPPPKTRTKKKPVSQRASFQCITNALIVPSSSAICKVTSAFLGRPCYLRGASNV